MVFKRSWRTLLIFATATAFLLSATAAGNAQSKGNLNPGVLPPQTLAFGKSLDEWAAGWFSWTLGHPIDELGVGAQVGRIFYLKLLPGVNRATVDPGLAIFVPIGIWATIPPLDDAVALAHMMGLTDDQISALTAGELSRITAVWVAKNYYDMSCTVDGRPIQDIDHYWFESGIFTVLRDPSFGCSGGDDCISGPAAAAGHSFILAPLPPGEHEISWSFSDPFGYHADITWLLTVGKK
jgi:hypothetical protein